MKLSRDSQNLVDSVHDRLLNLEEDVEYYKNEITTLESKVEEQDIEIENLTSNVAELSEYIQELENALAEAHLMSVDGPKITQ